MVEDVFRINTFGQGLPPFNFKKGKTMNLKQIEELEAQAEKENYQIHEIVNYHSLIGGPITSQGHKIKHIGWLSNGQAVAWLEGKSGCVSLGAISRGG